MRSARVCLHAELRRSADYIIFISCNHVAGNQLVMCVSFDGQRKNETAHVYSMGYITEWLNENDTSPNTNLILPSKSIMRLLSLKDVIKHFLSGCQGHHGAARVQSEIRARQLVSTYCTNTSSNFSGNSSFNINP